MSEKHEKTQEFEELLEKHDKKTAIAKFYQQNAKKIAGAVMLIIVLAYLAIVNAPVWVRVGIICMVFIVNYIHGRLT